MQGGYVILEAVARAGIDYIFSSPGSEWPPVWEALADHAAKGGEKPKYINCRHEALSVCLAAGYTKVTRRPQLVLLHASVGPLNAAMSLRAAYQERVPMVVCAGESAAYGEDERLSDPGGQWLHSLSDLGGPADMLRRCVKWSERILSPAVLIANLERAFHIAQEPPEGPVLLSIPFEWMMEDIAVPEAQRETEVVRGAGPEGAIIENVAGLLVKAGKPVVLTEHLGRDPEGVRALVELSEILALPVMETHRPAFLNFPRNHPNYLCHDSRYIEEADLILVVDAVSPWYPANKGPGSRCKVVFIGDEFPYARLPFWGYRVDVALVGHPSATLKRLAQAVRSAADFPSNRPAYLERCKQIAEEHARQKASHEAQAKEHAADRPIDPRWLCHVLHEAIPANAVVVEETTVHRTLVQNLVGRHEPMSYIARVTGGLGVGLGYALGAKLAMRDRPVLALIGDGAFHYNPVVACLGLAQEYELPIIIVLFNNGRYLSMERSLLKYFPGGSAKITGIHYGARIEPDPDYALLARAYGGYGVKVESPDDIAAAVKEALRQHAGGRLSLIDVVLRDYTPR